MIFSICKPYFYMACKYYFSYTNERQTQMKELDLYRMEFKKQLIGGYDRLDVLKKMQQLNSKYQNLMQTQKEYYESVIADLKENSNTTKVIHVYEDASSKVKVNEPIARENTRKEKVIETADVERKVLLDTLNSTIDSMNGYHISNTIKYIPIDDSPEETEDKIEIKFIDEDASKEEVKIESLEANIDETEEVNEIVEEALEMSIPETKIEAEIENEDEEEEPSLFDDITETNFFSYSDEDEAERSLNQDIIEKIDEILEAPIEEISEPEEVEETYNFEQAVEEIETIEKEIVSRAEEIIEEKPKKRRARGAIKEIEAPDKETIAKKRAAARRRKSKKASEKETAKPKTGKRRARGAIEELKSSN